MSFIALGTFSNTTVNTHETRDAPPFFVDIASFLYMYVAAVPFSAPKDAAILPKYVKNDLRFQLRRYFLKKN